MDGVPGCGAKELIGHGFGFLKRVQFLARVFEPRIGYAAGLFAVFSYFCMRKVWQSASDIT
jgi:hypothetical protein